MQGLWQKDGGSTLEVVFVGSGCAMDSYFKRPAKALG